MVGPDTPMHSFAVESKLAMVAEPIDNPVYDFDFRRFFACSGRTAGLPGVARVGAIDDYANFYQECLKRVDSLHGDRPGHDGHGRVDRD